MVLYRDRCKHISKKQSNSFIYHSESYEAGNALTRPIPRSFISHPQRSLAPFAFRIRKTRFHSDSLRLMRWVKTRLSHSPTSPRSPKTYHTIPWHPRAFPIPSSFQERAARALPYRRWERWISQGRNDPIGRVGRDAMLVSDGRSRYDHPW